MSHHCTSTTGDVISDKICIIGKLEYLWNKKRYHQWIASSFLFYCFCYSQCLPVRRPDVNGWPSGSQWVAYATFLVVFYSQWMACALPVGGLCDFISFIFLLVGGCLVASGWLTLFSLVLFYLPAVVLCRFY